MTTRNSTTDIEKLRREAEKLEHDNKQRSTPSKAAKRLSDEMIARAWARRKGTA